MYGMHIYNYKYIVNVNDKIAKFDCLFNGVTRMEMVWCDCTYPIILRPQEHTSLALYLSFGLCSTILFTWNGLITSIEQLLECRREIQCIHQQPQKLTTMHHLS